MRILVTGGDGQLGNSLKKATEKSPNEYIFTDADDLDITNPQAVALGVKCNDFQAIINCAAYTNVDRAEEQEEIAERINATAVGYLAKAAADNNIPLIHTYRRRTAQPYRSLWSYKTPRRRRNPEKRLPPHNHPYRMALFGIRQKLRQDHAQPYGNTSSAQCRF